VVFLAPPKSCYGAGYPSSARGFDPDSVPRIEVYYGWDLDDVEIGHPQQPSCRATGDAALFGKTVPLCRETEDGQAIITVEGRYMAESRAILSVSLVVRPVDIPRFLSTFKTLLATAHPCRATWRASDLRGKIVQTGETGHGAVCPEGQWY
jgi:hypothetical protein